MDMSPENRKEVIRLAREIVNAENALRTPQLMHPTSHSHENLKKSCEAEITAAIDDIQAILTYRRF